MNINEMEAKIILGALDAAELEGGLENNKKLYNRIRESFPNIDKDLKNIEMNDYVRGKAQQDSRVQEVRQRFHRVYEDREVKDRDWGKFYAKLNLIIEELKNIEIEVYNELASQYGLEIKQV